ncbi:MAG: pyruvate ferredoxin oxidoreductase [Candidatus Caldarchaeum sp.]|nr:pyruvate ferredoxin oxidoreductase [Candidatus Caldarchaeum sp.]
MLRQKLLQLMSGNDAIAYAVMQADVDVVAAYPITPQTVIVERLSEHIAAGRLDAEFVPVESEHSALTVCVGASLAGARVFTASASQGLALMHEMLYIASGLRCPIVMAVANRALSAPINIHGDHSDMMGSRDSGWIQIFAENPQEAYDFTIMAYRVAEDRNVLLPVAVNIDGFTVSHCYEGVQVLENEEVRNYLPRVPRPKLDYETPMTVGAMFSPEYYYIVKTAQVNALKESIKYFREAAKSYPSRENSYDVLHSINSGSSVMVIGLGGVMGTFRYVARKMNVGVVSLKLFRPFPVEDVKKHLENAELVVVIDRAYSPGAPSPPLASDIKSLLHDMDLKIPVWSVVCGLGGHEVRLSAVEKLLKNATEAVKHGVKTSIQKYITEEVTMQ